MTDGYFLDPAAPETVALQADYARRSKYASSFPNAQLDIAYGIHPRNALDVFSAGTEAPVIVFIHGGYWQAGSKDVRRFPAAEWNRRGVSWVAINYRLLPEYNLADAVADARNAVDWLAVHGSEVGLDPNQLHLTGNSAGAHLAAMVAGRELGGSGGSPPVRSLSVISGVFDLDPLLRSCVNDNLGLTSWEAQALSPVHRPPPPEIPVLVGYGGDETEEFAFQSHHYAQVCRRNGNSVTLFNSPGAGHIGIIGEYGEPGKPLFRKMEQLIGI